MAKVAVFRELPETDIRREQGHFKYDVQILTDGVHVGIGRLCKDFMGVIEYAFETEHVNELQEGSVRI